MWGDGEHACSSISLFAPSLELLRNEAKQYGYPGALPIYESNVSDRSLCEVTVSITISKMEEGGRIELPCAVRISSFQD